MILDLFAGPGGWDQGLRLLGHTGTVIGVEWDPAACATRAAAGHLTIRADVAHYPPAPFAGKVAGFIASPPCQDFSLAGKQAGRAGGRGQLIDEVPRWVLALRPRWVACEQVPPALDVYREFGHLFRRWGYRTWVGILNAADFGVPQTRQRAFLLASLDAQPQPPEPTHAKHPHPTMFGNQLEPWVSMADALGWGMSERPGMTFAPGTAQGGMDPVGGSGARASLRRERDEGRWVVNVDPAGGFQQSPEFDPHERPARTVTGHDIGRWVVGRRTSAGGQQVDSLGDLPVELDDVGVVRVGLTENLQGHPQQAEFGVGEGERRHGCESDQPAHEVKWWAFHSPATTIAGDPRITARCHHDDGSQGANAKTTEQVQAGEYEGTEPIRLTVREALILQGFDPSYPVQGTKTKQFEQVGNAVPPPLAAAVLSAVIGTAKEAAA